MDLSSMGSVPASGLPCNRSPKLGCVNVGRQREEAQLLRSQLRPDSDPWNEVERERSGVLVIGNGGRAGAIIGRKCCRMPSGWGYREPPDSRH